MNDYLVRIIAREQGVRAIACLTTEMAEEAATRHETAPTATFALAHALTGGALMGALLKVRHRVAIKFEGNGAVGKMIIESDAFGKVRGYIANPEANLPLVDGEQDLESALGRAGLLTVVKDVKLKELHESVVPLATSTIDGDLTAYLEQSEQIPSFVQTGVVLDENNNVAVSGGLLVQSMPPHSEEVINGLSDRMQELPPLADMLATGMTPEQILADVFADIEYTVLEQRPLQFTCSCSRDRSRQALITLGRDEVSHILETEGEAVIDCHFCHRRYTFDQADLAEIIDSFDA